MVCSGVITVCTGRVIAELEDISQDNAFVCLVDISRIVYNYLHYFVIT